jgi:hypothetical protein
MVVLLAALSAAAIAFFYSRGYLLYYGDAASHLNTARRIVDSRTPGWDQLGSPWLPIPHLAMVPLVRDDRLWKTGLAGAIPSGIVFVLAGLLFFLALRRLLGTAPAAAGTFLLALNPNLVYLGSIPMNEPYALASACGLFYFTVRFRQTQGLGAAAGAGAASFVGSLSRYEAWFLMPFAAGFLLIAAKRRRWLPPLVYAAVAGLGPLYWLAHNWWYHGDALEFFRGPYAHTAITTTAYPGYQDWLKAFQYFRTAVWLCAGTPLIWLGLAGILAALFRRAWWPLALLALSPAFYIWSMHSADTPIFVPTLWPHSYYNTRYALVALPLLALGGAALVTLAPLRARRFAAAAVVLAAAAGWLVHPRPENWVCWKESQVNSDLRRAWTRRAADFLHARYGPRDGVLTSFGDLTMIFAEAGIPIRETLYDGNNPQWLAATHRPDLFLREKWAVAISGDRVATAVDRARKNGPRYDLVETIALKGAPVIQIYLLVR